MLGVVSLGVASLLGGGGANSPDGAVRQLADAIDNQDPLAAVDVLAPDEVGALRDSVDGISERAQQLQLVDDAGKPLAGVDFEVGDLQLDNEELAPGYVKVTLHGLLISAQAHREGVAELIRRVWTPGDDSTPAVIDTRDLPPDIGTFVVAVQRNGSWYVSPAYTALEYVRVVNDLPAAEYGSGRAAAAQLGADTPEAAVQDALTAWSTGDWDRLWRLAPPNEVPVYDYRAALDQALADTKGPNFTIDSFAATAARRRRHRAGHRGGERCHRERIDLVARRPVLLDHGSGTNRRRSGRRAARPGLLGSFTVGVGPFGGGESSDDTPLHVTAVQRDGRWYISPVGTVLDIVDSVVSATTQDQIYALLGLYGEMSVDGHGDPRTAGAGQHTACEADAGVHGRRACRSTHRRRAHGDRCERRESVGLRERDRRAARRHGDVRLVQPVRRPGSHTPGRRHVSHRALRGDEQPRCRSPSTTRPTRPPSC